MVLRSVDFVPRYAAEAMLSNPGIIVVSITDPGHRAALADGFAGVLRLAFHDVDERHIGVREAKPFDPQDATKVNAFVLEHHNRPEQFHVLVHCDAGVSRSAAVALFVAEATGANFPRRSRADLANRRVLALMRTIRPDLTLEPPPSPQPGTSMSGGQILRL